jgi:predicted Abi (CAAX) family protease
MANREWLACGRTAMYLATGSIWPSVLAHWAMDLVWILFLGGMPSFLD